MKPTPKEHHEALDRHARIVRHLIEHGYAEDEKSADKIEGAIMLYCFGIIEFYPSLIITSNWLRSFFEFIFKAKPLKISPEISFVSTIGKRRSFHN